VTNSIFANSPGGGDCVNEGFYGIQANGVNMVADGVSACFLSGSSLLTGDPNLGGLADNAGPTKTHALLSGSPAINAVAGDCSVTHDQRGFERTDGMCDLGAFESDGLAFQPGPDFEVNVISDDDDGNCNPLPGDCTLREAIDAADANVDASTITFSVALPARIALTSNTSLPTVTSDITIQGQSGITVDGDCRENPYSGSLCPVRPFAVASTAGRLAISNLTIKNGSAEPHGGGIAVETGGVVNLFNSTLWGNSALIAANLFSVGSTITIGNSIIANPLGSSDCLYRGNPISVLGVNLVESGAGGCGLSPGP